MSDSEKSPAPASLEDQILRDEGEILHAYQDSLGFWTIGTGHLIDARKGGSIPQEISAALRRIDIAAAQSFLTTNLPWTQTLDQIRREALVNMVFNMRGHLLEFHEFLADLQAAELHGVLPSVEARDFTAAAQAMLNSLWARQVGERAKRLSIQIQTGVRQ